eukprot:s1308_g17.t1
MPMALRYAAPISVSEATLPAAHRRSRLFAEFLDCVRLLASARPWPWPWREVRSGWGPWRITTQAALSLASCSGTAQIPGETWKAALSLSRSAEQLQFSAGTWSEWSKAWRPLAMEAPRRGSLAAPLFWDTWLSMPSGSFVMRPLDYIYLRTTDPEPSIVYNILSAADDRNAKVERPAGCKEDQDRYAGCCRKADAKALQVLPRKPSSPRLGWSLGSGCRAALVPKGCRRRDSLPPMLG